MSTDSYRFNFLAVLLLIGKAYIPSPIVSNTVAKNFHIQKQNVNKKSPELSKSPVKTSNLHQVKDKITCFYILKRPAYKK